VRWTGDLQDRRKVGHVKQERKYFAHGTPMARRELKTGKKGRKGEHPKKRRRGEDSTEKKKHTPDWGKATFAYIFCPRGRKERHTEEKLKVYTRPTQGRKKQATRN